MEPSVLYPILGTFLLAVVAIAGFVWKIHKDSTSKVDELRNHVAWVNKEVGDLRTDLAGVTKDVAWLVAFQKGKGS